MIGACEDVRIDFGQFSQLPPVIFELDRTLFGVLALQMISFRLSPPSLASLQLD